MVHMYCTIGTMVRTYRGIEHYLENVYGYIEAYALRCNGKTSGTKEYTCTSGTMWYTCTYRVYVLYQLVARFKSFLR